MKKIHFDKTTIAKLWKKGGALFVIIELAFISMSIIVWYLITPAVRNERIEKMQSDVEKSTMQIDQLITSWNSSFHKRLLEKIDDLQKRQNIDALCRDVYGAFPFLAVTSIQYRDDTIVYYYCPTKEKDATLSFDNKDELFDMPVCQNNARGSVVVHGLEDSVVSGFSYGMPLEGGSTADVLITLYARINCLVETLFDSVPRYKNSKAFFIDADNDHILCGDAEVNTDAIQLLNDLYGSEIASFVKNSKDFSNSKRLISNGNVCFVGKMTVVPRLVCIVVPLSSFDAKMSWMMLLFFFYLFVVSILILVVCARHIRRQTKEDVSRLVGEREILMASSVQKSMLSKPICDESTLDIDARFISAKAVGGDLYYCYAHNGVLYFCIGDVSSKGVPAAMYMSRVLSSFRNAIRYSISSSDIAEQMNQELCLDNDQMMFVTSFIGVFRIKTGELNFCNAGHEKPLLWTGKNADKPCFLLSERNPPMGIMKDWHFIENTMPLPIGAKLTLYTDGVNEAMNKNREMYGRDRLLSFFCRECTLPAAVLNQKLVDSVAEYTQQTEQSDDIAILTICAKSLDESISFSRNIESLSLLQPLFSKLEALLDVDKHRLYDMRTAIDEMVTNVIKHGYTDNSVCADIVLRVKVENDHLYFILRDNGVAFNPLGYKPAERDYSMDNFTIGGFGISMMRSTFANVEYQRNDGYNLLTMYNKL